MGCGASTIGGAEYNLGKMHFEEVKRMSISDDNDELNSNRSLQSQSVEVKDLGIITYIIK